MMDFIAECGGIQGLSRAAFFILAFSYAGFKAAKHDSLAIFLVAAAGALAYAYFSGKPAILLGAAIFFSANFVIRWFWSDIKYWYGRYRNWSLLNPGKDATISIVAYMMALMTFLL